MKRIAISVIKEFLISLLLDSRVVTYINEKIVAFITKKKNHKARVKDERSEPNT